MLYVNYKKKIKCDFKMCVCVVLCVFFGENVSFVEAYDAWTKNDNWWLTNRYL